MRTLHWWYRLGIRWYNPVIRTMEDADAPMAAAQAIDMLSGAPDSNEFIAQYRLWRQNHGTVEALLYTGEYFRDLHTVRWSGAGRDPSRYPAKFWTPSASRRARMSVARLGTLFGRPASRATWTP